MLTKGLTAVMLLVAALAVTLLPWVTDYAINLVEYAYVSSSNPNTNYANQLRVAAWVEQRRAWMKFDFSEIPSDATITSASIRFYCSYIQSEVDWNFIVGFYFASNSWTATTITWNNQPTIETSSWAEINLGFIGGTSQLGWHSIPSDTLKSRIQSVISSADKKLTVVAQVKYARSGTTYYATFDTAYIDVEYTTPTAPTPTPTPTPSFKLSVKVKDQCGNPLPAYVVADGKGAMCDQNGEATLTFTEPATVTLTATVNVGKQSFNATQTITITAETAREIIVNRRFLWKFYVNYTDGSVPFSGNITASSPKETVVIPVSLGQGEGYLIDTTYTLTFEASPAVSIGSISPRNDGAYYVTVNPETGQSQTSSTEGSQAASPTVVTIPSEVRTLILQMIIIALILLIGVIIMGVIAGRKKVK